MAGIIVGTCETCGETLNLNNGVMACAKGCASVQNSDKPTESGQGLEPSAPAPAMPGAEAADLDDPCPSPVLAEGGALQLAGGDWLVCLRMPETSGEAMRAAAEELNMPFEAYLQQQFASACARGWLLDA